MCNVIVVKQTVTQPIQQPTKMPPNLSTGRRYRTFTFDSISVAPPRMPSVPAKTSQMLTKSVATP